MKTQLELLLPWVEVERCEENVQCAVTPNGVVTRERLYVTREHDQRPDDETEIVAVTRYNRYDKRLPQSTVAMIIADSGEKGSDIAIPEIAVWLPGFCGHYEQCGVSILVCIN